jgi:SAM-dependent methyltransferase
MGRGISEWSEGLKMNLDPTPVDGTESVDSANRRFYSTFPYPWPPMTYPVLKDQHFETVMLNQGIGDFTHGTIPVNAKIWVAGCGTNQAVFTALRFPKASVVGSDLSPVSLDLSRKSADALGIKNLKLREENLNCTTYDQEFDYILNTGVIHHNAEPVKPLANIAKALRPNGVLELMVYNRYHRTFIAAFQRAVRIITRYKECTPTYEEELEIAKAMAREPIVSSAKMARFRSAHNSEVADALIQPVEHSHTVESLDALVAECGLELMLPCYDQFDHTGERSWTIDFSTAALRERIDALPDVLRWQVTNLLLLGRSPKLWFFVRHQRHSNDGYYEARVNKEFLDRTFVNALTTLQNYVRGSNDLNYKPSPVSVAYPIKPRNDLVREILRRTNAKLTMRQILNDLQIDTTSQKAVSDFRVRTTTPCCPYLRAVAG